LVALTDLFDRNDASPLSIHYDTPGFVPRETAIFGHAQTSTHFGTNCGKRGLPFRIRR
jgi:hypothetical protein